MFGAAAVAHCPYDVAAYAREIERSRRASAASGSGQKPSSPTSGDANVDAKKIRTRAYAGPYGAGVVFEQTLPKPATSDGTDQQLSDDDIIIVTVRVASHFRRASLEGCEELPSRPPPRGFLRRMSTRWQGPIDEDKHKVVKMPRREYLRHFKRDKDGNYTGSEPERPWSEDDIEREFGVYQDMPLKSILLC